MQALCDARNHDLVRQRTLLTAQIRGLHRTERQQRDSCRSKANYIAGLFFLSNADTELVLTACAACKAANPPTVIELRRQVDQAGIPELQQEIHFWSNSEEARARHARDLLRQWRLHGWIHAENVVSGRAPSSAEVYTRRGQLLRETRLHEFVPNEVHSSPQRWVKRFQRRWSMHRRTLEAKAIGVQSAVSGQVRCVPADPIFNPSTPPETGPIFGRIRGPFGVSGNRNRSRFAVLFPGPQNGPVFESGELWDQVSVAWAWMRNLLHRHALAGKRVLRINCDETNIQRAQRASRGLVVAPLRRTGPVLIPEGPDGRGSVSHLVFICDDPLIQPVLPQVVVGNERMLRLCDLRILEPEIPPNVYVVRQKSSWINDSLFQQSLIWLHASLQPWLCSHGLVLVLDCAPAHLTPDVLLTARRLSIHLVFVPRKMTWLLQPCDTHVFRRYKAWMHRELRADMIRLGCSHPTLLQIVRLIVRTDQDVLQRHRWRRAFDDDGWCSEVTSCSGRVRRALGSEQATQACGNQLPSLQELRSILPRQRSRIAAELIHAIIHETVLPARRPRAEKPRPYMLFPLARRKAPWPGRTSRTRVSLVAGEGSSRAWPVGRPLRTNARLKSGTATRRLVESLVWRDRLRPRRVQERQAGMRSTWPKSGTSLSAASSSGPCPWSPHPDPRRTASSSTRPIRARPLAQSKPPPKRTATRLSGPVSKTRKTQSAS